MNENASAKTRVAGLVHDARSAHIAFKIGLRLNELEQIAAGHRERAEAGLYGDFWGAGVSVDMAAQIGLIGEIRKLLFGFTDGNDTSIHKKQTARKFQLN